MKYLIVFLFLFSFAYGKEEIPVSQIKDSKMALESLEKSLINQSEQTLTNNEKQEKSASDSLDHIQETQMDTTTQTYEKAFLKMILILICILAVVIGVFILFKKFSGTRMQMSNHTRSIKILEKRAISPKSMLYLVEIGGQKLLLAESQLEIRNVSNLDWLENTQQGV